jgi:hypothetical protein
LRGHLGYRRKLCKPWAIILEQMILLRWSISELTYAELDCQEDDTAGTKISKSRQQIVKGLVVINYIGSNNYRAMESVNPPNRISERVLQHF